MVQNKFANENTKIIPRAAVVQDMSGFGRVSLTEAIPAMSAMGVEVCPLPTAVLSTHTYEFKNYTLLDLTDEMEKIIAHWNDIGLEFDAVYSGYMSSSKQIDITKSFMLEQKKNGALLIVDPVLGDNALLDVKTVYSDRMTELIGGMRGLCAIADTITPNLTEACLLLEREYPTAPLSDRELADILTGLSKLGADSVLITSVMDSPDTMCVAVYDGDEFYKIDCGYVSRPFHGTGDLLTSVFTGARLNGYKVADAANLAVDFLAKAIELTVKYPQMPIRHGVLFEPIIRDGYFAESSHTNRMKLLNRG